MLLQPSARPIARLTSASELSRSTAFPPDFSQVLWELGSAADPQAFRVAEDQGTFSQHFAARRPDDIRHSSSGGHLEGQVDGARSPESACSHFRIRVDVP